MYVAQTYKAEVVVKQMIGRCNVGKERSKDRVVLVGCLAHDGDFWWKAFYSI